MSDDAQITRRQFNATVAAGAAYTALTPFEAAGASARASQTRAHQELILPVTQAGFSARGLPVGVQIVGRHRDEWSVLQLAYAFEQATHHGRRRPALLA